MAQLNLSQRERDVLVACVAQAYEALALIPGVDQNGPALVWLAEHMLHVHRRSANMEGASLGSR
jgi:hypothetical protein